MARAPDNESRFARTCANLAVTMVVNDVIGLMTMHDGVMMMHRHCSSTFNPCVCLAVAM